MAKASRPRDFDLVLHRSHSDSYELSSVLLAKAGFDGTLQLLTAGWQRVLGYGREELQGKRLSQLMWADRARAAVAVAAVLDTQDMRPVDVRVRCRNGTGKCIRLHRLHDRREGVMYLAGEETSNCSIARRAGDRERRRAARVSE